MIHLRKFYTNHFLPMRLNKLSSDEVQSVNLDILAPPQGILSAVMLL